MDVVTSSDDAGDGNLRTIGFRLGRAFRLPPDAAVRSGDGYRRVECARLGLRVQRWDERVAAR
jgi:hypothetical protein